MTTYRLGDILTNAKTRLRPISPSASLDAQLLIAEILEVNRSHIIAHPEKVLTPAQADSIEALIARREQGEPIAYILGRRGFYDREFMVTPDVLIPRPETEHLIESALEFAQARQLPLTAVDVGTGSGAIACTFKGNCPSATVYATDISESALQVARKNASLQTVDVTFMQGDLLQPMIDNGVKLGLIMANLPYIETEDMHTLAVSQHEPHLALDGGEDGLDLVRRLLAQVPHVATYDTLILLEIGAAQGEATVQLARDVLAPTAVSIIKDYAGHDRIVRIHL